MSGGYTLTRCLGSGSFGEIWEAKAPGGIWVAVRVCPWPVHNEIAKQVLAGLELIKTLRQPHLQLLHAFFASESGLFLVMELAERSLRDRFNSYWKQQIAFPTKELVGYILEAAQAIDFLHNNNIVHAGVKPENILLLRGHVKVADYGMGRARLTLLGSDKLGTFGKSIYLAPEVLSEGWCPQSDQYALACTYVDMRVSDGIPVEKKPPGVVFRFIQSNPSQFSVGERNVLFKALAPEREMRYGSCLQFARALA